MMMRFPDGSQRTGAPTCTSSVVLMIPSAPGVKTTTDCFEMVAGFSGALKLICVSPRLSAITEVTVAPVSNCRPSSVSTRLWVLRDGDDENRRDHNFVTTGHTSTGVVVTEKCSEFRRNIKL